MDKDCFVTKGCFGFPAECLHETNDCKILLTYYSVPNGVRFNLYGHLDSLMYMAVGLSEDGKMVKWNFFITNCYFFLSSLVAGGKKYFIQYGN